MSSSGSNSPFEGSNSPVEEEGGFHLPSPPRNGVTFDEVYTMQLPPQPTHWQTAPPPPPPLPAAAFAEALASLTDELLSDDPDEPSFEVRAAAYFKVDVEHLFSGLPPSPPPPPPPEKEEELDIRDLLPEPLVIPDEAIAYFGSSEIRDILHIQPSADAIWNPYIENLAENPPPLSPRAIAAHAARWEEPQLPIDWDQVKDEADSSIAAKRTN